MEQVDKLSDVKELWEFELDLGKSCNPFEPDFVIFIRVSVTGPINSKNPDGKFQQSLAIKLNL